jgi:lipoprotein-releasing system ATP-binding protein
MAELDVRALSKAYPTRGEPLSVLRNVSLRMVSGDGLAVLGPSGCGKSTLLHILGTLEAPSSGTLAIDGQNPFALSAGQLSAFRNRRIGFVFQEHHLLPQCTALENVLLPLLPAGPVSADGEARARALLQRVGLADRLSHRPAELSGGERQRAAIARALICGPSIVLADEPTGNLDRATAAGVTDLLLELHAREQNILIVVTHSESLAARMARRVTLNAGMLEDLP